LYLLSAVVLAKVGYKERQFFQVMLRTNQVLWIIVITLVSLDRRASANFDELRSTFVEVVVKNILTYFFETPCNYPVFDRFLK